MRLIVVELLYYVVNNRYLCCERYHRNASMLLVSRLRHLSLSANQNSSSSTAAGSDSDVPRGRVFDCQPARVTLAAGKTYGWCTCGYSNKQPMCDGSHKAVNQQADHGKPEFRSHKFEVDEEKEYVLCNCKQTSSRPFCDGSHKQRWIQAALKWRRLTVTSLTAAVHASRLFDVTWVLMQSVLRRLVWHVDTAQVASWEFINIAVSLSVYVTVTDSSERQERISTLTSTWSDDAALVDAYNC